MKYLDDHIGFELPDNLDGTYISNTSRYGFFRKCIYDQNINSLNNIDITFQFRYVKRVTNYIIKN